MSEVKKESHNSTKSIFHCMVNDGLEKEEIQRLLLNSVRPFVCIKRRRLGGVENGRSTIRNLSFPSRFGFEQIIIRKRRGNYLASLGCSHPSLMDTEFS